MPTVPTLSNEAQVKVMNLVKQGKTIDEAIKIAQEMAEQEKQQQQQGGGASAAAAAASGGSGTSPESLRRAMDRKTAREINAATLEAVTKMVQEGNITAKDAIRHAEMLNSVRVRKKGDAQRILLMNMVKEGNISISDAVRHAEGMGVDLKGPPPNPKQAFAQHEGKVYNFPVHKIGRLKAAQRRILQLDFETNVMCNVQKGQRLDQIPFEEIQRVEVEDGTGFVVTFTGEHKGNFEYEAESLEDKNKIFRIITVIVNYYRANHKKQGVAAAVADKPLLKEGRVEKKGHSMVYFNWSSRWLRVRSGELAYYKEEDLNNPLHIVQLGPGISTIGRKGSDLLLVHTNKKTITFRIPAPSDYASPQAVQKERDEWFDTLMEASEPSAAGRGMPGLLQSQIAAMITILKGMVTEMLALNKVVPEGNGKQRVVHMQDLIARLIKELAQLPVMERAGGDTKSNSLEALLDSLAGAGLEGLEKLLSKAEGKSVPEDASDEPVAVGKPVTFSLERATLDEKWGFLFGPANEVTELEPESVAAKAGVEMGMVLVEVNDESVVADPPTLTGDKCAERINDGLAQLTVKLKMQPTKRKDDKPNAEEAMADLHKLAAEEAAQKEKADQQQAKVEKEIKAKIAKAEDDVSAKLEERDRRKLILELATQLRAAVKELLAIKAALQNAAEKLEAAQNPEELVAKAEELHQVIQDAEAEFQSAQEALDAANENAQEAEDLLTVAEDDDERELALANLESAKEGQKEAEGKFEEAKEFVAMCKAELEVCKIPDREEAEQEVGHYKQQLGEYTKQAEELREQLAKLLDLPGLEQNVAECKAELDRATQVLQQVQQELSNPEGLKALVSKEVDQAQTAAQAADAKLAEQDTPANQASAKRAKAHLKQAQDQFKLADQPSSLLSATEKITGEADEAYQAAVQALEEAQRLLSGQSNIDKLKEDLAQAEQNLSKAQQAVTLLKRSSVGIPGAPPPPGAPGAPGAPVAPPPPGGPGFPPPPPGLGGIPPPPGFVPPPPGLGGIPPPPGMGIPGMPVREPIKPNVKMRAFHWAKVPPVRLGDSMWWEMIADGDKPVDSELLEEQFAAEELKELKKKEKKEIKTLLDTKRAQNLGIFMSGFKIPMAELSHALSILPPDEGSLPVEHVIALRKLGPTPEEVEAYDKYKGDKAELSDIDQFLMRLMEVPQLRARLDLLLTIHEFPLEFQELAPEISKALAGCKELLLGDRLKRVMHFALSIGNYVNGSTPRGGAHGILLKTLPKMADSRGRDKQTTLMDFLFHTLETAPEPDNDLIDFWTDLTTVVECTETSVKGLSAEVEILARDLLRIDKSAAKMKETSKDPTATETKFFEDVNMFVNGYEEKLVTLHAEIQEMTSCFTQLLKRFGENPSEDSETVFTTVASFVAKFKEAESKAQRARVKKPESYADQRARAKAEKAEKAAAAEAPGGGAGAQDPSSDSNNPFAAAAAGSSSSEASTGKASPAPDAGAAKSANPFAAAKPKAAPAAAAAEEVAAPTNPFAAKKDKLQPTPQPRPEAAAEPVDPDMPDRAGGYGENYSTKEFEVNANPDVFKEAKASAPQGPYNPFGAKKKSVKRADVKSKAKRRLPERRAQLDKLIGGKTRAPKWEKRYFELATTGHLHYYKKEGGKNVGSIYLRGCRARADPEDPLVILIQTEDKMHTIRGATETEARDWLTDIQCYL